MPENEGINIAKPIGIRKEGCSNGSQFVALPALALGNVTNLMNRVRAFRTSSLDDLAGLSSDVLRGFGESGGKCLYPVPKYSARISYSCLF